MSKPTEKLIVNTIKELCDILDREGVDNMPVYCGFGFEVYENRETQKQVLFNCRGRDDNYELVINRGF